MKKPFTIALILVSLLYLSLNALQRVNVFDEGFVITNTANILRGLIPYRDFFTIYSPGEYYILAVFFRLFGSTVLTERIVDTVFRFVLCILVYFTATKITSRKNSFIAYMLALLVLGSSGGYGYPIFPALIFALLSIRTLFTFSETSDNKLLLLSGVLTGGVIFFRHDFGGYLTISSCITLLIHRLLSTQQQKEKMFRLILSTILFYVLGVLIVLLPLGLFFYLQVPLQELWADLIGYQAFIMKHPVRRLPFPSLIPQLIGTNRGFVPMVSYALIAIHNWVEFYFPPTVFFLSLTHLFFRFRKQTIVHWDKREILQTILLTLFGSLLFLQAFSRADHVHYLPSTLIAFILFAKLLYVSHTHTLGKKKSLALIIIMITLLKVYGYNSVRTWFITTTGALSQIRKEGFSLQPKNTSIVMLDPNQAKAIAYIQTHVPEDEYIFVGLPKHDVVFINDASFYFLSGRKSPKHYQFDPGIITSEPVQRDIIQFLTEKNVQYVVIFTKYEYFSEKNESSISSGVTILDQYIREQYSTVQVFGDYRILKKHEGTSN